MRRLAYRGGTSRRGHEPGYWGGDSLGWPEGSSRAVRRGRRGVPHSSSEQPAELDRHRKTPSLVVVRSMALGKGVTDCASRRRPCGVNQDIMAIVAAEWVTLDFCSTRCGAITTPCTRSWMRHHMGRTSPNGDAGGLRDPVPAERRAARDRWFSAPSTTKSTATAARGSAGGRSRHRCFVARFVDVSTGPSSLVTK